MPSLRPTACAVVRLSPVSITTRMRSSRRAVSAPIALSLIGSATATSPAALPSTAISIAPSPSLRSASARSGKPPGSIPSEAKSAWLPTATRLPSTAPTTPLPVSAVKSVGGAELQAAFLGAFDDRSGERMLAAPFEAGGQPQQLVLVDGADRNDADEARLALGQGPGLVDDQGVDLLHQLERFGVLDEDPGVRAAPGADHDRHRRRQSERAGTGDDQHRDRVDQRKAHRRRRTEYRPDDKRRPPRRR